MNEISGEDIIWACWILQAVFCGAAVLVGGLSFPMYYEKIPPNRWYGVRTKSALENEKVWYRVNKLAGKYLLYACLFIFVLNLLFLVRLVYRPEHIAWLFIMLGGQLVIGDGALLFALGMAIFQTKD